MPAFGTLPSDTGSVQSVVNFASPANTIIGFWNMRTKFEQILLVIGFVVTLSFTIITIGLVADDQGHVRKLETCAAAEIRPFTRIMVAQDLNQQKFISQKLSESIDKILIQDHLKNLTKNYHVGGSEANLKIMDYIANTWRSYGLDKVEIEEYNVLLSYPDYERPNTVYVKKGENFELLSEGKSTALGPKEAVEEQERQPGASLWWNAYAKPGTTNATIIYANRCGKTDFEVMRNFTGKKTLDFQGAILICRYGTGWRGGKVFEAEKWHAGGILLYLDPEEYGPPQGSPVLGAFPYSNYVPATGAQRGSLMMVEGDPETPQIPSKPYAYRFYNEQELREKHILPNVPVMPLGYGDVKKLFESMKEGGVEAPKSFRGGLNVTYYFNTTAQFQLNVNAVTVRKSIRNVFGYIVGEEEPDKLVLLSNHADAWTYGSQDPNSGTAINLAVSHAYMSVINSTGWRPRRTLQFCAWDAEEYGLVGSTEWVEQKLSTIQNRVVALVNVDTALQGNVTLAVKSVPLLYRTILNATRTVNNPNPEEKALTRATVYDSWLHYRNRSVFDGQTDLPYMSIPAGGSDFKTFLQYAGVPVLDLSYQRAEFSGYALYHTLYEVYWTVENLLDRNFETALALSRVWTETTRHLADSLAIPFNVTDYGVAVTGYVKDLINETTKDKDIHLMVENFDLVCSNLTDVARRFLNSTIHFQKFVDSINAGSATPLGLVQRVNDRIMHLERVFLTPGGLPGHPGQRHVVFGASEINSYGPTLIPGVRNLLERARITPTLSVRKMLNNQFSILQYSLESAIDTLSMELKL